VWASIQAEQPDALVLLGDNVYLDTDVHTDPVRLSTELHGLYQAQKKDPYFAALLADLQAQGKPLLATYDDHDFLGDNRYGGDHDPALRETARALLIQHFNPPRTGSDVYSVNRFGLVDLFMLDERFYRRRPLASALDRDAILGAGQWEWFEREFRASSAPFIVIGSSTTVHTWGNESWEMYPAAFNRLRDLVRGRQGALVLSGDVHRNAAYDDSGILEIVTSAVARESFVFGKVRDNYAVLTFAPTGVRVELRSRKAGWRFDFTIPLGGNAWELP
jgi:alkaline phosphatase D